MIDIHNHILPGLDEGSFHIEITKFYLEKIHEANMHSVVFTPQYFKGFMDNTKDITLEVYNKIDNLVKKMGFTFQTYLAAEVYLIGRHAVNDIHNNMFMINGSRYVLIENSMTGFSKDLYQNIHKLVKEGYKPILAHPESYKEIIENPSIANDFMHRDVYLQINTKSILGKSGDKVKDVALELIDRGYAHFLGTDCKCKSGHYDYLEAFEVINDIFGEEAAKKLSFEFPDLMIQNEDVPYFYKFKEEKPKKMSLWKKWFGF